MKVFSLNIWFSDYLKLERAKILYNFLLDNNYDIILLQEVTLPILSFIYKELQYKYPHIHFDIEDNFYGVCIISKFEIHERQIMKFKNSKMNRSLIFGKIKNIILATTHLESEFDKLCTNKINQFNDAIKLLSKYENVCFIGDTNLTPKNDKFICTNNFKDAYLELDNSKENKYTYDGVTNPIISNKLRSRIDRIYYKNLNLKNFLVCKDVIMSDHFGMSIEII